MRSAPVQNPATIFGSNFNNFRADAAGAAGLLVHQQLGYFSLGTNPVNGKTLTLTINGSAVTFNFVSSIGTTAGNVLIGATPAITANNFWALALQPGITTANGVALLPVNQQLVSYLSFMLVGTTLTISSNNNSSYAPLTSFTATTNATSDSYTANTMALFIEPGNAVVAGSVVNYAGGSTPTFTAPSTNPRIDLITLDGTGTIATVAGTEAASPSVPAYPNGKLVLAEVYHRVGETSLYDNANQQTGHGYLQRDSRPFFNITQTLQAGLISMWSILPAPSGWLVCDGSAISRTTYSGIFGAICPVLGTVTITIASPGVVTFASHGLATGDALYLTTSGALPTGLTANTQYWVIKIDTNTFKLATSLANALAGTAINTSGSQSGTQTTTLCPYGVGDGSTTFNLPNLKGRVPVGVDQSQTEFSGAGQTGGEKTHLLTSSESGLPAHIHSLQRGDTGGTGNFANPSYPATSPYFTSTTSNQINEGMRAGANSTADASSAHNNLQPYITLLFIIKT